MASFNLHNMTRKVIFIIKQTFYDLIRLDTHFFHITKHIKRQRKTPFQRLREENRRKYFKRRNKGAPLHPLRFREHVNTIHFA